MTRGEIEEMDQAIKEEWVFISFYIPKDFEPIWKETIRKYKDLWKTDKFFPAIESIIVEANNSLEQHGS